MFGFMVLVLLIVEFELVDELVLLGFVAFGLFGVVVFV